MCAALMLVTVMSAQKQVALRYTYYGLGNARNEILNSADVEFISAELYFDEVDLLSDPRFRNIRSLSISARNYRDTLRELPWSVIYLDTLTSFHIENISDMNWPQCYSLLSAIPSLES